MEFVVSSDKKLLPYGMMNFADIRLDGYYYVDKTMYSSQISDFISALIIYLCGFVLFFKFALNNRLDRRAERENKAAQAAAPKEGGDQ